MSNNKYHDTRFAFDKGRTKVWKAINEYLQKFVPREATVLDLGCGYADFINGIKAKKKYAIDLNPEMARNIRDKETTFTAQSALDEFSLPDLSADVVFASNFMEHFDNDELDVLLSNIKAKLKPAGKLILIQPNIYYAYREYWDDYTHKKAFSHSSLSDFLKSHDFNIIHTEKKFIPFSLKSRLPKSYFLTKMYLKAPFKPFAKQLLMIAKKN